MYCVQHVQIFSCPVHGTHLVASGLGAIVRAAAHLQMLSVNSFYRQCSNMFSVCLLTVFGLFTNRGGGKKRKEKKKKLVFLVSHWN